MNFELSVDNIIHRIGTQTCAGCHHYGVGDEKLRVRCPNSWPSKYSSKYCFPDKGVLRAKWPDTLGGVGGEGFTHVAENAFEEGEDEEVFDLNNLGN